jgi:tight adherence protein B
MTTILIFAAIAVGIGGMIFAAAMVFGGNNEQVEDRLASLTKNGGRGTSKLEAEAASILRHPLDEGTNSVNEFVARFMNLETFIEQSGLDLSVSKFIGMTLAAAFGAGALCYAVSPWISLVPIAAITFGLIPLTYVWWVRGSRLAKFGTQLPEALDLMAQALRAGQSLPAGIQLVGTQMKAPLGPEFQRAFEEQNLGVALTDTLVDMADRIPDLDLRFFVTAVVLQRQTGGDLAEILDKIGHLIRERYQIKGQIQALTGEGRMSGAVLLAMPPSLFLLMLKLNYKYEMLLFTDELGQYMLGGAIFLQLVGAYAIKKIIDIKV